MPPTLISTLITLHISSTSSRIKYNKTNVNQVYVIEFGITLILTHYIKGECTSV